MPKTIISNDGIKTEPRAVQVVGRAIRRNHNSKRIVLVFDPSKKELRFHFGANGETLTVPGFLKDINGLQVTTLSEEDQKHLVKRLVDNIF